MRQIVCGRTSAQIPSRYPPNEDDRPAFHGKLAHFDNGKIPATRVLHRIRKQIGKYLFYEARIAIHGGQFSYSPIDLSFLAVGLKITKHALRE